MKIFVFQCIVLFFLIFEPSKAQKLEPVLKLEESKNYELYIMDKRPDEPTIHYIKTDGSDSVIVSGQNNIKTNIQDKKFSKVYVSKKTGLWMLVNNFNNFIINDQQTIRKIEKEWVGEFHEKHSDCGCERDYLIFICNENKIVQKIMSVHDIPIIETCAVKTTIKPFDTITILNRFYSASIHFSSEEESKNFINDARKLDGIYVTGYDWFNYDGSFCLKFNNGGDKKIIDKLKSEIKKQYPKEKFNVEMYENWEDNSVIIEILCNKSLADAFSKYKIYRKWEPFTIEETEIFFKDLSQILGLIDKYFND